MLDFVERGFWVASSAAQGAVSGIQVEHSSYGKETQAALSNCHSITYNRCHFTLFVISPQITQIRHTNFYGESTRKGLS